MHLSINTKGEKSEREYPSNDWMHTHNHILYILCSNKRQNHQVYNAPRFSKCHRKKATSWQACSSMWQENAYSTRNENVYNLKSVLYINHQNFMETS